MTIPISQIVQVTPGVISAGGLSQYLTGLLLTTSSRSPIGSVLSFPTAASVGSYYGLTSGEFFDAQVYFNGFTNSNITPGAMLVTQYPLTAVAAWLRGGPVNTLTITQLQALSGTLSVVMDGYTHSATAISLASASSYSAAATLINAGLTTTEPTESTVTASIGGIVTGAIATNSFTASISGTAMVVTAVVAGTVLAPGQTVSGGTTAPGTNIVSQTSGTTGGTGTYAVSVSQTVVSGPLTTSGAGLTVSAVTSGVLAVGQVLTGTGVTTGTTITALGTGAGAAGTYAVSVSQTVASETINAAGTNMTVSAVTSGVVLVGQTVTGTGVTTGTVITAQVSGTAGGVGSYTVSAAQSVTSETMTGVATAPVVTYDSISGGFLITSGITGVPSTAAYATGTLAASLFLTQATGAVLSQGAAAATPAAFMTALTVSYNNFATFWTAFDPDQGAGNAQKLALATWTGQQNNRFAYICWDTDITATQGSTTCLGYLLQQAATSGTILVYEPSNLKLAAFIAGYAAAIDTTETNGRTALAFRTQSGLTASVTDPTSAANLIATGYNYYGAYANATLQDTIAYPGSISGPFLWADSFLNQIWMNSAFQNSLWNLLLSMKSIPYNLDGYTLVKAALQDPINAALNFGSIRAGVQLSQLQIAEIRSAAGLDISSYLFNQGYYVQVLPASSTVRAARKSPPCTVWYVDGQSIQAINLASIEVQ